MIYKYEHIKAIHLEPTQKCQAACPFCDRYADNGHVLNKHLDMSDLSLDYVKEYIPKDFIKQLSLMYMCGNHGDPIFAPDALEIMKYFRELNPHMNLSITTNGGWREPEWWEELAANKVKAQFSVDGLEDTNHIHRQHVKWDNVERNIEAFTDAGGDALWMYLVFNHNEHQVESARMYSQMLGVKKFVVKKSARFFSTRKLDKRESVEAKDRKGNVNEVMLKPENTKYHNKETSKVDDIVEKFGSMENFFEQAPIQCKADHKKEIYISAWGEVTPCCWTQNHMYKAWEEKGQNELWKIIDECGGHDKILLHKTPLKNIIEGEVFNGVSKKWNKGKLGEDRLKVCAVKCNVGFDPFGAQWS